MEIILNYHSTACNPAPNICDWCTITGLICYGSCNSVIICNPKHPGTNKDLRVLNGHTARVTTTKWIRHSTNKQHENEIVSGTCTGEIHLWNLQEKDDNYIVLKGHTNMINAIDTLYTENNKIIASGSLDHTVIIWQKNDNTVSIKQTIQFSSTGTCTALKLAEWPGTKNLFLACGREKNQIELYVESNGNFQIVQTLEGHDNWVRGLDFITDDSDNGYLASGSQDATIHIWSIAPVREALDSLAKLEMTGKKVVFPVVINEEKKMYSVTVDSVLCGHEGWVYGVCWFPKQADGSLQLLSSSLDKTMIIWVLDKSTGLWMEKIRVGEVGGNTLGFFGSLVSGDSTRILSYGYLGSFHLWNYCEATDSWEPGVKFGGHFKEVIDMAWEPNGEFLFTVSADQSTRIHAPWRRDGQISWHEIARPQVHGYDINCIAVLSRYKFVSGAEEKIPRAFQAPMNFIINFRNLCQITTDPEGDELLSDLDSGPKGASVPSLGLSNRAVFNTENKENTSNNKSYPDESHFNELHLKEPPTEEDLLQNTLWPEVKKLYGHGYEVFSVAASKDGKLLASACKSTTAEHASIILWDAQTWQQKQVLQSHILTITQMSFSPDDRKLLSVSRDRRWTIFELNDNNEYIRTATLDKNNPVHKRVIWCCSWAPDSAYFVTGSRDGKIAIWRENPEKIIDSPLGRYELAGPDFVFKGESVTAIDYAPVISNNTDYILCVGMESGGLELMKWNPETFWEKVFTINKNLAHHLTVSRIFFRPRKSTEGSNQLENLEVATCSTDHSVRIFTINVK